MTHQTPPTSLYIFSPQSGAFTSVSIHLYRYFSFFTDLLLFLQHPLKCRPLTFEMTQISFSQLLSIQDWCHMLSRKSFIPPHTWLSLTSWNQCFHFMLREDGASMVGYFQTDFQSFKEGHLQEAVKYKSVTSVVENNLPCGWQLHKVSLTSQRNIHFFLHQRCLRFCYFFTVHYFQNHLFG